ncbi:MAG: 3-keto-5-aminohexanoate cleavage protein [Actinomycetota bacterium]|nr:3-keto-5-aminohexanoate cleavage protein [Actinomycetota bacterium]
MLPLIITVAAVGAELSLEQQPNLPVTPDDLARDAAECAEAGASIYHLHVRDASGRPTMEVAAFERAKEAITASADVIVQFTTGGAVGDPEEARVAPLRLRPEMATLTTGSVNFGDEVFLNPAPLVERLYREMRSVGTLPEYEIFEAGMIANAARLYGEYGDGHHQHYDLVLGVPGAMPASPGAIPFLVAQLPEGATWSATGIGKSHLSVARQALAEGGHVRTGFEDVRYVEPGRLAVSNAELIARVAKMAAEAGREVATPGQARAILEIN